MEATMDMAGVREALHARPFVPFSLRLADGRALPAPHPAFVAITPRRVIVGATDDSWSVVEPALLVSVDHTLGKPTGDKANGETRGPEAP
jgi:hypothetical protein